LEGGKNGSNFNDPARIINVRLSRLGMPEDVVGAALFLSSRGGAFVKVATIVVDDGFLVSPQQL